MYQDHKGRQSISNRLKQEGSWDKYTYLGFKPLVWAEEKRESDLQNKRERQKEGEKEREACLSSELLKQDKSTSNL